MSKLDFNGRVAIVTGAGGGLGRSHALLLGSLGAKVVVNDLGGQATGGGKSSAAADKVVEEIKALGGEAVANYDSVENGESIVKTALDAFGTVDIVINNAGILRDVSFGKMTQADWDIIMQVHLNGSMSVSHAAWPIMREKGYGRIIMTTSAAGIYGNFGQANYCAAKLGILGLAQCLAVEGASKNIHVNTIAPIAASRLTETVMPAELLKNLKPESVSPLVAWLCHEECKETKGLFEVGAGYIGKLRWERTLGYGFAADRSFSIDDVKTRWGQITDFTDAEHPSSIAESVAPVMNHVNNPPLGGNQFIDLDLASKATLELTSNHNEHDVALYALGIGAARDPMDTSELKYVYEMSGDFTVFPTYGAMPMLNAMLTAAKEGALSLPGCNFGLDRLLHGEQYTEIKRPLKANAKLEHKFKLKNAYDKDPNAVVTFAVSSTDETGEEVAYNEFTAFVKGAGGWGGDRGPSADENVPPARDPDAVIEEKTDMNQTLLYRLSGDWNPLHADPNFAKAFGYDRPILHGMCTFGHVGRHVIKSFANNDGRLFKSIKVRFAKSVFPGDTLVTRMWKESDTRIIVETSVKERDEVVIKNAVVELYKEVPAAKAKAKPAAVASKAVAQQEPASLTPKVAFSVINAFIAAHPDVVKKAQAVVQVNLTGPESQWVLDLKNGSGSAHAGTVENPDVTMIVSVEDFLSICEGDADAQKLFFAGKVKLEGNMMVAQKLDFLRSIDRKFFDDAVAEISGGAGAVEVAVEAEAGLTPAVAFSAISSYIAAHPDLVKKAQAVVQFNLNEPDSQWVLDLKNDNGSAHAGTADKPDVTMIVSTADFISLCKGEEDAQKMFFAGKVKLEGNMMVAQKLDFLRDIDKSYFTNADVGAQAAPVASTNTSTSVKKEAASPAIFAALGKKLQDDKSAAKGLSQVLQFNISGPDASWTVDFSVSPAVVKQGTAEQAAAVLGISDANLVALVKGTADIAKLFQRGDLRVDGDVSLARQLTFLNGLI